MPAAKYPGGRAVSTASVVEETEATPFLEPREQPVPGAARKDSWVGDAEFALLPWWRRPSVYWLLGPFFLFTLAFGGCLVPKLNLIVDLVCRKRFADQTLVDPTFTYAPVNLGADNPQCFIPEVKKSVSMFTMALSLITGILSAVAAPRLGHLSDRYGRTKLLALASCGGCASELIFILCAKFPDVFHYNWLLLAATCDGLTGSFTAGQILSNSYTSDCTPPSRRAINFGRVHACLFMGLAVGPLLASYLVALTGSLLSVFYVTLGCHLFFVTFVGLVVPESLSRERQAIAQKAHDEVRAAAGVHAAALRADVASSSDPSWFNTHIASAWTEAGIAVSHANVFAPLKALWPTQPGSSPALRRNLVSFAIVDTILLGAGFSVGTVLLLYCESENTWNWKTPESSRFISAVSFVRVFVLLMLLPAINYFFRTRPAARRARETGRPAADPNAGADTLDISLIRVALVSDLIGSLGYLLARREGVFVASGLLTAVGGLGSATIQSAATKHVPAEQVGKLLGAVGLLQALSRVVGPIAFNSLYYATVGVFDQAIFALLVGLFSVAVVTTLFIRPHVYLKEPAAGESEEEPLIRRAD